MITGWPLEIDTHTMPLTQQQLESIKAANFAKSVAWEAAHFLPGDIVMTHGHRVKRTDNAWISIPADLQYATLSRWARTKLHRQTFDPKSYAYLIVGQVYVPMFQIPPITERCNYSPWTAECPRYDPEAAQSGKTDEVHFATNAPAPATTEPSRHQNEPISRLDGIDERLDYLDSVAMGHSKRLKNLENDTESCEEDHHKRILALQSRIDYLEERLLAVASVAAHIGLFKDRIEKLEAKNI